MIRLYRKRDLASPLSEFLGAVVIAIVLAIRARRVLEDFPDELRTFDDLKEAFD